MTTARWGMTPLMHATYKGNMQCMKELIAAGADVYAEDEDGSTPLIYAACSDTCSEACMQTLLDEGADVNACNTYRDMAVLWAIMKREACASLLIKWELT